ncbi:PhzF family phenazine biosynthesis protein [Solicola sp. PLA-1-18]|uniref:PhzF family phenazine biosynthesis protein n=1 Tax=Solicola sp. PLA-1-18 TaxID=3380532 RepID=UPI003B786F0A
MDQALEYAAFTLDGTGGNPAGVVLGAEGATDAEMLAVAARLGHSETAFVVGRRGDRDLDVRYFSPLAEVAFCGHATVATGVALAQRHGAGRFELATAAGPIAVDTSDVDGVLTATLTSAPTRTRPARDDELAPALSALGWTQDDLDPALPPHVSHAGNDHLVLGVRDRSTLRALDYDYEGLDALMTARAWTTVHLVWREDATRFHARDPFPPGGVVEDPATGAAAAAFGGYLRALGLATPERQVTVLQGHDMGRPSRLLVDLVPASTRVRVTGTASRL